MSLPARCASGPIRGVRGSGVPSATWRGCEGEGQRGPREQVHSGSDAEAVRLRVDDPRVSALGPLDPFRAFGALRSAVARLARAARADHGTLNERTQRT